MDRARATWVAGGLSIALAVVYGLTVSKGAVAQIDHNAFLSTLGRMRGGQGYYDALRDTFLEDVGVRLGGPRSFRTPFLFELWGFVPTDLLYPTYLAVVVVATSLILGRATDHPFAAVPVTLFLLVAGRTPDGAESWMLVELWAVPLLALSHLGWRRERSWLAALAAAGAVLVRELAFPVLLLGLVLDRRHRRPWLVGTGVAVAGYGLHTVLAMGAGFDRGTESDLFGTGDPPGSVVRMLVFAFPLALGVVVWALALLRVVRGRVLVPVTALLGLPLLGLLVDRPYWGILATPFALLWAGELVGEVWSERAAASRARPTMEPCSDPRPAPSPMRPAPTSSRTPTAG